MDVCVVVLCWEVLTLSYKKRFTVVCDTINATRPWSLSTGTRFTPLLRIAATLARFEPPLTARNGFLLAKSVHVVVVPKCKGVLL